MKPILIATLCIISFNGFSQRNSLPLLPIDSNTHLITYKSLLHFPGKTKAELYKRAKMCLLADVVLHIKKPLIKDNEKKGIVAGVSGLSYKRTLPQDDSTKLELKFGVTWNLSIKVKDDFAEVTATNFKYTFNGLPPFQLELYYHGSQESEKMTGGALTPIIRAHDIALFTKVDSQAKAEPKWVMQFIPFKPAEF